MISQLTERSLAALAAADITDHARGVLTGLARRRHPAGCLMRARVSLVNAREELALPERTFRVAQRWFHWGPSETADLYSASAWARRLTSEPRFSRRASMGRPGRESSSVNSQASFSRSSQPPSENR